VSQVDFARGRHHVDPCASAFWQPSPCAQTRRADVTVVGAGGGVPSVRRAAVLELRADTVGEQTDVPLNEYAEDGSQEGLRRLR